MLIRQVTLNDCGAYAGRHAFNFATDQDKPVILVGGLNGGGKTTLFESVLLCLYGMTYAKLTRKAYERRLLQMVHRRRDNEMAGEERRTSVAVEFTLSQAGHLTEYMVERSWRAARDGIGEELVVKKRSPEDPDRGYADLDSVERDQWQSFINGLVPRGIAGLFFFDGEMVAQMAEEGESAAIRSSFNSLLGLDIVEQLQADLRTNLVRNLTGDDRHIREELSGLAAQKAEAESKASRLRESRVRREAELGRIRARIEEAESRMERLGGGFAEKRQDTKTRLASSRAELDLLGRRITELCSAELPFGLIPQELNEVARQMDEDRAASRASLEAEIVARTTRRIRSAISADSFLAGDPHREETISSISEVLEGVASEEAPAGHAEVFGFSGPQQERISGIIRSAAGSTLEAAAGAAARYAQVREEATSLETALDSAPADDEIGPIVSAISKMHEEAGRLENEVAHLDQQAAAEEAMIRHIAAKTRQALSGQYKNKKTQRMADLTGAVQKTLDAYADRLRAEKMGLLESYVLEAAGTLMHKEIIEGISIDPETFEVSLHDADRNAIPRETLSKGEQQMLATSILWGLARTSGRPLPFMIDTPLARLDTEHRANLIERFLPLASHQTVVLSTNTEIGAADYARLLPYISRSYTIRYDPGAASTMVREGYFWDGEGNEV